MLRGLERGVMNVVPPSGRRQRGPYDVKSGRCGFIIERL
jgi:hypothetical protein